MSFRRSTLQIHLNSKKPYQSAIDSSKKASNLIRLNEHFLSLFCFYPCFYSAPTLQPWKH